MPEFLHEIPVFDNTSFDGVDFRSLVHIFGDITDLKVECLRYFFIAQCKGFLTDILCLSDECRDIESGLKIACIAHFGVACSVINNDNLIVH
jgi:hypothetical protein